MTDITPENVARMQDGEQLFIDEDDDACLMPEDRNLNLVALPARDFFNNILHPEVWVEMVRRFNAYPALTARVAELEELNSTLASAGNSVQETSEHWRDRAKAAEARIAELEKFEAGWAEAEGKLTDAEAEAKMLRDLLGRYVEHVRDSEGTDFLQDLSDHLTDEQLATISRINNEYRREIGLQPWRDEP